MLSDSDIDRILLVIVHSHAPNTCKVYGSGILVFHVFCDSRNVLESQWCPASSVLLLGFLATCAGLYMGSTLKTYFYGIRAWHLLHGQPWVVDQAQASFMLEGAKHFAPVKSTHPKCAPFTMELLLVIHSTLNLTSPLHAAVFGCLTTSFFTIAHTGEFTMSSLKGFDPETHVKVGDLWFETDCHGFRVVIFHLPHTKTSLTGEDVYWAAQSGLLDPKAALNNHFAINTPLPSEAPFSWCHQCDMRVLTQSAFMKCLKQASECLGMGDLKGHGIWIGGTLEYLLWGVPFKSVKAMG
ncbi:hypothetical protein BDR05DRAFT_949845 [Suillus weaverae]|nr:hypothetical protein BDR05DRAFT_949845 [Suillus weaverae]